jgi:cytochrome c-type biogenesis protein CcmH
MKPLVLALTLVFAPMAQAAIDTYAFDNDEQQARFSALTQQLRCPKCQNQDLADSNAPIAADLRREVHRLLSEGKSDQQVVDYLVARYGEFVRYKPAFEARTWLLWVGPGLLLITGAGLAWALVRRRRPSPLGDTLSDQEQQQLAGLLKRRSHD